MNTLEESLALAKAWLDSVDDKTFYQEYQGIKEYSNIGPTTEEFISFFNDGQVLNSVFYVETLDSNSSPQTNNLNQNVDVSTDYSLSCTAVNDENYALAA